MPEEELVDLKFCIYDGTDIGPFRYSSASTISMLKERIVAEWPKGCVLYVYVISKYVLEQSERDMPIKSIYDQLIILHNKIDDFRRKYSKHDKKIIPKAANDIKLINAGKILENNKTVGQCRVPFGELPKGVITMHVVVQPSFAKAKTEKKVDEVPRKPICACSIL